MTKEQIIKLKTYEKEELIQIIIATDEELTRHKMTIEYIKQQIKQMQFKADIYMSLYNIAAEELKKKNEKSNPKKNNNDN